MVLPRFVAAAVRGEPLVVHDDGRQSRCFAHVGDIVRAVLALMQSETAVGRVYNIGSDRPITILDLARRVIALAGSQSPIEFTTYAEAYDADFEDVRARVPELARIRTAIGWQAERTLDDTILELIAAQRP
jgi:UDP-glucose 4-epimerase